MRVLCVAEKPSISKSITGILSGGRYTTHNTRSKFVKNYEFDYPQTNAFFTVTCVAGHLTEHDFTSAHRKWQSCNPVELFDAPVESRVAEDKKAIEENLKNQAYRSDMLMIWTDCDREGEHIGMEIVTVCRRAKNSIVVKRARFSAIIAQQIHRAAQNPVELDYAQADAVEARILLDLKIGAAFTRMQTMSLQTQFTRALGEKLVSYGPCQFPTLGFVVQRYNQVKNFVPEPFWYIFLSQTRNTPNGPQETTFNWCRGHLFDEDVAVALYAYVLQSPIARVTKVTKKETKKWKPLPLTTVELQKAGSRLLKMAPKKVLDIAEKLYQQGFLSYPRTETDQFDPQFDFTTLIHKQTADISWGPFAQSLEQGGFNVPRKGKHNDKAHPPIHPTAHAGGLTGDEKRVYEYITRRFLACCSKDAEGWQTTVEVACGGEIFSATGLVIMRKNYLEVYPYDKWSDHPLPEFTEGETFNPTICELRQGQTSKPNLLTEADLVALMDKNGIGTDATIAQHIQTIVDREYVLERMEGSIKYLVPSTLGVALVEGYNHIGLEKSVCKPQLRRETERRMVQVCERRTTKQAMLEQSLQQYKEMFRTVTNNWGTVVQSVRQHLEGNGGNGAGGGIHAGNPHGFDDSDDGGNGGGGGSSRGGGTGSRGARGGRRGSRGGGTAAPTSNRSRGGRPRSTSTVVPVTSVTDMDEDPSWLSRAATGTLNASSSIQEQPGASTSTSSSYPRSIPASTRPIASGSNSTTSQDQEVLCECGIPAAKKTNMSGVNSIGKAFYTCSKDTCGLWKWADDTSLNPVIPTKRMYSQTNDDSTKPARKCKCNVLGALRTVQKEGANQGRKFWKCQNSQTADDCGFFEWDDEPPRPPGASHGGGASGSSGSAGSGECYNCHQEGHWSSNCPNQGDNPSKRPRSFGASADVAANATCYKCDKKGHLAPACPGQPIGRSKSTNTTGGGKATGSCYKCGQDDHWANVCPSGTGSTSGRPTSSRGRGRGGTTKRGRGRGSASTTTPRAKRGRGTKKSSFAAADDW
ncbi:prokaryotic type I DNA topoisomerase [Macrolepiota fuliginosa MF-IS2]|uniref:DNA topoisomerase n=1 Tax=Macrolepiota fuliginosa MF-IS2 TaxID=1400762 RepID=A0A9P5XFC5_9AGAR|nr:prokaryotic type I DNA topoisomerase [Macrolepiota fuliginosa MF-IS2]